MPANLRHRRRQMRSPLSNDLGTLFLMKPRESRTQTPSFARLLVNQPAAADEPARVVPFGKPVHPNPGR